MSKIKVKKGSWGADIEELGRVEIRFKRPSTSERFRMAPVVGRAADEVARYWTTYEDIRQASDAALAAGDAEGQLVQLRRLQSELAGIFVAQTWDDVADVLADYCEQLTIDGEQADEDEVRELIGHLSATDAHLALQRLYKAQDGLSEAEGKRSASTSAT